jgi:hypothetical protein
MTEPSERDGFRRERPGLPIGLVAASVVIAVLAVSGLIYLLYEETRGPGEILRRFAEAVDAGDCERSYELLHDSVRVNLTDEAWCTQGVPTADAGLDADFTLVRAVLGGDRARVEISGVAAREWVLGRYGDRSWRVIGPPGGF